MRKQFLTLASMLAVAGALSLAQEAAPVQKLPLAERIAHTEPSKYRDSPSVHGGPGQLNYMGLFNASSLDTNLYFLHRGIIQPKSGIGAHFHNQCEEMFVIFDGEAQFTVNGRTSTLKGPAGAPTRMGSMHAIYNATDKPVQWMNINVSARKGVYDAFDLSDGRVGVPIDPIPGVHDDAAGSVAAASDRCAEWGQGDGSIPARAGAERVPERLVVCRPSAAAAGDLERSAGTGRGGRVLLRDERAG
jgi:mannose-6-phosphate isomerase-like protein (cupin superfamily)